MENSNEKNTFQSMTQIGYDRIAQAFSASRTRVWKDLLVFSEYLKPGMRVLDLGCGNGRLYKYLLEQGCEYVGVDSSAGLITEAKQKYPDGTFYVMDALQLTFDPESFDAVVTVAVLNHFPTQSLHEAFLRNIFTLLKPQGWLLMANWNMWNINNAKGLFAFNRDREMLDNAAFLEKYTVEKAYVADKDVLTVWDEKAVLYYYAFEKEELELLVEKTGFISKDSYYSLKGETSNQSEATNIITLAQRP